MPVQRAHDTDPGERRRAAELDHQHKRLNHGPPQTGRARDRAIPSIPKHVNEITACAPPAQYTDRGDASYDPTTYEAQTPAALDRPDGDCRAAGGHPIADDFLLRDLGRFLAGNLDRPAITQRRPPGSTTNQRLDRGLHFRARSAPRERAVVSAV